MDRKELWTKDFIFAMLANLFVALVFYLQMTTLAVYSFETYNTSVSMAGLTASIFIIGALFSRIFAGRYIELIGRRKLVYIGGFLFWLVSLAYFIRGDIGVLLAVRFIHGIAFGIFNTAVSTLVLSYIPRERQGEGIGYFTLSPTLATAIGPLLGIFITRNYNYNILFGICAGFAFCALILILFAKIENIKLSDEQLLSIKKGFRFSDFFETRALPISVVSIIWGVCYASITTFINPHSIEIGLADAASAFFLVYAAVIMLSRPLSGKLLDRKGDNVVMYPAIIFFSAALLMLGLADSKNAFLFSAVLFALGFGNIVSNGQTIAVKFVPQHRIGTAISTFFVCMDIGMGIGPVIMGLIVHWKGYSGMYIIEAGIIALSILLYYFLRRWQAQKQF